MIRKNIQHLQLKKTVIDSEKTETDAPYFFSGENNSENQNHGFAAGFAPFLRGTTTTMYVSEPWKTIQNPVFLTLKDWNLYLKKAVETQAQPLVFSLENTYNLIQTLDDFAILFEDISLENFSILISTTKKTMPILALYLVFVQEKGLLIENLAGILKINPSDFNENTKPLSAKIFSDILDFSKKKMPKLNAIQFSGFEGHQIKISTAQQLAYTLMAALEFMTNELILGAKIDVLAPKISFVWTIKNNAFETTAQLRAARILWAKMIKKFNPQNPVSMALQQHCQTSNSVSGSLDPIENLSQTCIEAAMAVFGGAQALQTDLLTPTTTPQATRLSRDIQLFLKEETKITKTVDPWGGSFYLENRTNSIAEEALKIIQEMESLGGFSQAVASFFLEKHSETQSIFDEDLDEKSIIKVKREEENLQEALQNLRSGAQSGQEKILELMLEAAKYRATIKEMEDCLVN